VPSLWLADGLGLDTCFVDSGSLYTIGGNCVEKSQQGCVAAGKVGEGGERLEQKEARAPSNIY